MLTSRQPTASLYREENTWSRKLKAILLALWVSVLAAGASHHYTKRSCHSAGMNDGALVAKEQVIDQFTRVAGDIAACTEIQLRQSQEVLTVKTTTIRALPDGPNKVILCNVQ